VTEPTLCLKISAIRQHCFNKKKKNDSMDNNDSGSGEQTYRNFTQRESENDYSRWTLLRRADKSASITSAVGKSGPRPSGGVTFKTPQKRPNDLFAPGTIRSTSAEGRSEERFSPLANGAGRVSIMDVLSGDRKKSRLFAEAAKAAKTAPKPQSKSPAPAPKPEPQRPQASQLAQMRVQEFQNRLRAESGAQGASIFSQAFPGSSYSNGSGRGSIAEMLSGASRQGGVQVSIPKREDPSRFNEADRRQAQRLVRGTADDALRRASTLDQLRSAAAEAEASSRRIPQPDAQARMPADSRGHIVFSRKYGQDSTMLRPQASPRLAGRIEQQGGPARYSRLFECTPRVQSGRRRESLKEIYRRIESCQ
jgi:hypothetical protein